MDHSINSDAIIGALAKLHDETAGWLFIPELRVGTGYDRHGVMQRIDAWAIQCWDQWRKPIPEEGFRSINVHNLRRAFEIKVNPTDVLKELRDPDKRWYAYAISHEFYFVTPPGLINPKLLAKSDGLMEFNGERLRTVKSPRVRETMPPRWDFVASAIRTAKEQGRNEIRYAPPVIVPTACGATDAGPQADVSDKNTPEIG